MDLIALDDAGQPHRYDLRGLIDAWAGQVGADGAAMLDALA